MSDQTENEGDLTKNEESKLHPHNPRKNNNEASSSSPSKPNSIITGENSRQTKDSEISPVGNQTEVHLIEKIINERKEIKKQKNFIKLPTTPPEVPNSGIQENVGDDLSKKKEIHILCECEPNVTGAAVPTVTSFVNTEREIQDAVVNDTPTASNRDGKTMVISKNKNVLEKATSMKNNEFKPKVDQADKERGKRKVSSNKPNVNDDPNGKNYTFSRSQPIKTSEDKVNKDNRTLTKKPSLIPKLSKSVNDNKKSRDQPKEKNQNMSSLGGKLNVGRNEHVAPNEKNKKTKIQQPKVYGKPITLDQEQETDNTTSTTISSRMRGLQERLKATTSMLRQTMEMDKSKDQTLSDESIICSSDLLEETRPNTETRSTRTLDDLYANISQLKDTVFYLSESASFGGQRKYIEKLFISISEIRSITNKLCESENDPSTPETSGHNQHELNVASDNNSDEIICVDDKMKKSSVNAKDNKIHITILKHDAKKKKTDLNRERSEEIQTELSLSPRLTSESLSSNDCLSSKIKDTDSMDGVFIPTYEPPVNIEDEEETFGLDITITFPEFEHLQASEAESHLPVCVSDISAEALKKLKRCPKDFKLLMDFVEGKLSFQSGAGPANNFSIGPDLKFIANVDYKKSEIINIKPSTECLYSSQLIPVETLAKPRNSVKTLKSTDSELLFNVVNLPFLYRNPYTDDSMGHKSCIAFNNDKLLSVAMIAGQFFKSMPQIPSLTNIFEEELVGNFSKTESGEKKEKSSESEEKD